MWLWSYFKPVVGSTAYVTAWSPHSSSSHTCKPSMIWPLISGQSSPVTHTPFHGPLSRMGGRLWAYETSCPHWAIGPPPKPAHTCYLPGDLQFVLSPICLPALLKKLNSHSHHLVPGPRGKSHVPPFVKALYPLLISVRVLLTLY